MKNIIFATIFLVTCLNLQVQALEWWENANYYQVYPKSYADADNDGTGDLQGIRSKIPYLKELGMDAVWLSPCFNSSWKDGGYDISNYTMIDPLFGTMKDFDELLATCKENDVKLILDFVPNHSSNEHEWFIKSEQRDPKYKDYYVWHPGKPNPAGGRNLPPSNWNNYFRGSAWEWSEVRGEYYLHQFAVAQPDLNYRNPDVVEEMKNVLRFWLDKGIDGVRIDMVPALFEVLPDKDGNYPDEPLSGWCEDDPLKHCYLDHIYTLNRDENFDMVYQWREVLDKYKEPKVMMTEAYNYEDILMRYYGDENRNGSHIPFNFIVLMEQKALSTAKHLKTVSENYMNRIPAGKSPNWVLGNHDQRRIQARLGGEAKAELYNFYLQTMPGNAITYQGEEIIMDDVFVSWEETQDPQACNTNQTVFDEYSRDPARTPMQWNNSTNAGFNNGTKTWLPVGPKYIHVNVAKQESDENSHLKVFKKLVQLHKLPAFRHGLYESANHLDEYIYSYIRSYESESYLVAMNFAKQNRTVNFSKSYRSLSPHGDVVVASLNSNFKAGSHIHVDEDIVLKYESAIVVKLNGASMMVVSSLTLIASVILCFFRSFVN